MRTKYWTVEFIASCKKYFMLRLTNASSSHQRAIRANHQAQSRHLPAAVFLHQRYSVFTFIQSATPHSVGTDREPQGVILR